MIFTQGNDQFSELSFKPAYMCYKVLIISCYLFSAAGPHAVVNGNEVVNFASANYLGLVGHEKLLVSNSL